MGKDREPRRLGKFATAFGSMSLAVSAIVAACGGSKAELPKTQTPKPTSQTPVATKTAEPTPTPLIETPTSNPARPPIPTKTPINPTFPPTRPPTPEPTPPTATRTPQIIVATPRPATLVPEPTKTIEIGGAISPESGRIVTSLINQTRAQNGLTPLNVDLRLQRSAELYAQFIFDYGWLDNRSANPHAIKGTSSSRAAEQGYSEQVVEILSWAVGTDQSEAKVLQAWLDSPAHKAGMLSTINKDLGVGCVRGVTWYRPFYPQPVPVLLCLAEIGILSP